MPAEGYRRARAIARRHGRSFYLSSLLLGAERRRAVWAVYAFCRVADDIADRDAPVAERLAALDAWERELRAAYAGAAREPLLVALGDAARRFGVPLDPALALLRGTRRDVVSTRYASYEELAEYCYLVASTVGLLVLPILGTASREASRYAIALGRAMQLTNILRDVGEDARRGRLYLPADELRRFDCSEERIAAEMVDARFVALMRFQIARARALYDEAEPGIALLARGSRPTVRLARSLYRGILDRIEANGYDVFRRRAVVPLRSRLALALPAMLG